MTPVWLLVILVALLFWLGTYLLITAYRPRREPPPDRLSRRAPGTEIGREAEEWLKRRDA